MINSLLMVAAFVVGADGFLSDDSYYSDSAQALERVDVPPIGDGEASVGNAVTSIGGTELGGSERESTPSWEDEGVSISFVDQSESAVVDNEGSRLVNIESADADVANIIVVENESVLSGYVDDGRVGESFHGSQPIVNAADSCCGGSGCESAGCDSCCHSTPRCRTRCCCLFRHRFDPSPWHSPGNMPQHFPYVAGPKNYYYFRPYSWLHIVGQQQEVKMYGGDPRHPYANDLFQDVYREIGAK